MKVSNNQIENEFNWMKWWFFLQNIFFDGVLVMAIQPQTQEHDGAIEPFASVTILLMITVLNDNRDKVSLCLHALLQSKQLRV